MTPEKVVQNKIMTYLHELEHRGLPVISDRRQAGGFSYKMGQADLWACIDGLHIEIEVKRPGGQLRTMQEKWRDRCKAAHILWICCDDVQQLKSFVEEQFKYLFEKKSLSSK